MTEPGPGFPQLHVSGIPGIPEISPGDDLGALIAGAARAETGPGLRDGDIVVITSKVVSKAEGRVVSASREDAIAAETVRVVARRGATTAARPTRSACRWKSRSPRWPTSSPERPTW